MSNTSTQDVVGVGCLGRTRAESIATALVDLTLKARQLLPHAANGQPKAPSDESAANMRRAMKNGESREWYRLYTVAACDIADGVPVAVVTAAARQFIAEMELLAAERTRSAGEFARPMGAVIAIETKAQQRLDLAELKLAESPTSVAALEAVVAEADRYLAPFEALRQSCRQQLAVIRTRTTQVVGRRNGRLALHA